MLRWDSDSTTTEADGEDREGMEHHTWRPAFAELDFALEEAFGSALPPVLPPVLPVSKE